MEPATDIFESGNEAKANFDRIYNQPDPRLYYRTLGALDYRIPTEARPIFRKVMQAMERDRLSVVDVGCSYGVNAAMIQYDLEFSDLVARYREPEMKNESIAEAIVDDASFFDGAEKVIDASFTGIDVAEEAIGYARAVGLIDEAVTENLEEAPLSAEAAATLAGADLIITTGAVGYVTERTFSRIVDAVDGSPPWVAAFSLRQFPFAAIADELTGFGLETEKLKGRLFPQRRFRDGAEKGGAIAAVEALGLDPAGLEAEGGYFAEFFLATPKSAPSLADLRL
jgi:hypothetical protein